MDDQQIAQSFHEDGYAIVRGVFAPDEVAELERQLNRSFRRPRPCIF
jgi:molybdopterin-biosynthesis enzyme MoeA-like protein